MTLKSKIKNCEQLRKKIQELKKIYPDVVDIVNNWQMMAEVHGDKQSKKAKRILTKYVKILKDLGVLNDGKN